MQNINQSLNSFAMKTKYYILITVIGIISFLGFSPQKAFGQEKESIEKFVRKSIDDLNSADWADKVKGNWSEKDIKDHKVFRESFANYNIKIKHLVIDGNDVVMWGEMSGTFVKEFPVAEFMGSKPNNKTVTWNEVWYFNVVNGKFGDKWDWTIDGISRMKQAGIKCLPKNF